MGRRRLAHVAAAAGRSAGKSSRKPLKTNHRVRTGAGLGRFGRRGACLSAIDRGGLSGNWASSAGTRRGKIYIGPIALTSITSIDDCGI
jgi:hypothetical protein